MCILCVGMYSYYHVVRITFRCGFSVWIPLWALPDSCHWVLIFHIWLYKEFLIQAVRERHNTQEGSCQSMQQGILFHMPFLSDSIFPTEGCSSLFALREAGRARPRPLAVWELVQPGSCASRQISLPHVQPASVFSALQVQTNKYIKGWRLICIELSFGKVERDKLKYIY